MQQTPLRKIFNLPNLVFRRILKGMRAHAMPPEGEHHIHEASSTDAQQPRQSRWQRGRDRVLRLLKEESSPKKIGIAVFLGVLIGISPFWGLHLVLCIALASLLRVNRALTYTVANVISLPWFLPFIVFVCVEAGYYAFHGHFLPASVESMSAMGWMNLGQYWLVGGLIVGPATGILLGLVVALTARYYALRKGESNAAMPVAS